MKPYILKAKNVLTKGCTTSRTTPFAMLYLRGMSTVTATLFTTVKRKIPLGETNRGLPDSS